MLVACEGGGASRTGARPTADPRLEGSLLAVDVRGALKSLDLPSGTPRQIELPESASQLIDAFWAEDGSTLYAFLRSETGGAQLYDVSEGQPLEAVGPELQSAGLISRGPGRLLASECGEFGPPGSNEGANLVLDLAAPTAWRRLPAGCPSTLSPDGREIAYSPDGRSIWRAAVDGSGRPVEVLKLEELEGVPAGGPLAGRFLSGLDWGRGGLGFVVGNEQKLWIAVADPDGEHFALPLANNRGGFGAGVAWQPEGDLLAVQSLGDFRSRDGVLRVLEPATRQMQVVGVSQDFYGLLWSPRGDVMVVNSRGNFIFIDLDGVWLGRVVAGDTLPTDWSIPEGI
jgi:hypothetical protein